MSMFEIIVPDAPSAVLCTDMFFETFKTVNILEVENQQKAPPTVKLVSKIDKTKV